MTAPEETLAAFVADTRATDLPPGVAATLRRFLLDAVASALAGRVTEDRAAAREVALALGGPGPTTVLAGGSLSMAGAVFLNAWQVTAATICDVHRPTLCHVTPVVVPPALAIAEREDLDGRTLLAALAVGMETAVRVASAFQAGEFRARGWHAPGVVGPLGGAAAVARLLGLDGRATRHAIALGGSQAAGTFAALGTSAVKFHQARGALSGLLAGLHAAAGFEGARRILTDPGGGMLRAYAGQGDASLVTDGLGQRWALEEMSLRRWPAASSVQAVIDALLRPEVLDVPVGDVDAVAVALPEASYRLNGEMGWGDQLSALQSARWIAAVVLHDRACWLPQFAPERLSDGAVGAFARERVTVGVDPALPGAGAGLTIRRRDGRTVEVRVPVPPGDPSRPLDDAAVVAKLERAAEDAGMSERAAEIAERILAIEGETSVAALVARLRRPE